VLFILPFAHPIYVVRCVKTGILYRKTGRESNGIDYLAILMYYARWEVRMWTCVQAVLGVLLFAAPFAFAIVALFGPPSRSPGAR